MGLGEQRPGEGLVVKGSPRAPQRRRYHRKRRSTSSQTLGSPWACRQLVPACAKGRVVLAELRGRICTGRALAGSCSDRQHPTPGQGEGLVFAVLRGASLIWSGGRKPVIATAFGDRLGRVCCLCS